MTSIGLTHGWPDLFVHKKPEFFFAEVKSSNDELHDSQLDWIYNNSNTIHLPYILVSVLEKD